MAFELDSKRGVMIHYGVRTTDQKFGGNVCDEIVKFAAWTFNYNDLPVSGTSNMQMSIPAGARILRAELEIITAFTSTSTTTDLTVGLSTAAGGVISADGLILATEATQTTIATVGNVIVGATGGLLNKTIGTTAGEVVVAASAADLLTGRARLIVEYLIAGI